MKKTIFILLLFSASVVIYSCTSAEASKPMTTTKSVSHVSERLKEMGFTNVNSVVLSTKQKMIEKYGLNFIGDLEMDSITKANGFIWASSLNYIGAIPEVAANKIVSNYKLVESEPHYYAFGRFKTFYPIGYAGSKDMGIFVVAPAEYFTPGAVIINKDPIVVIKIDGGWLELARW